MNALLPISFWLEPDRIFCGSYPRDFEDRENHEGIAGLLRAGVRVFIDLTEPGEGEPYAPIALACALELGIDPADLKFHRFPIREGSVPKSEEQMRAILRTIRLARHRHKRVSLHCSDGGGRTTLVAGCILIDLFYFAPVAASALAHDLWMHNSKAPYPQSPETREQTDFVCSFKPFWTPIKRVREALLGAAVGDALGVPVEFARREARKSDPVTGMREFGTHHQPAGTWSDDTSMILATMKGLVHADTWSPETVMEEFSLWLNEAKHTPHGKVFDVGHATSEAMLRYAGGTALHECGGTREESNGNGSLMRILPVALAFANVPDLIEKASELSSLTHAHERSRLCCAFYCLVISELLHGEALAPATSFAWEVLAHRWDFSEKERVFFERWHPERLFEKDEDEIGSSGHVVDTLEAALWVNARHDNYRDAVLHAVNLGDDTDTTACVAGALAGILYGEAGIPRDWIDALAAREALETALDEFSSYCGDETFRLVESELFG